jgi:hypothetical protein
MEMTKRVLNHRRNRSIAKSTAPMPTIDFGFDLFPKIGATRGGCRESVKDGLGQRVSQTKCDKLNESVGVKPIFDSAIS